MSQTEPLSPVLRGWGSSLILLDGVDEIGALLWGVGTGAGAPIHLLPPDTTSPGMAGTLMLQLPCDHQYRAFPLALTSQSRLKSKASRGGVA